MPDHPPQSPAPLAVSVVLHHSDLTALQATLQALDTAVRRLAAAVPVPVVVVDQSLDADYSARVQALIESLPVTAMTTTLTVHDRNRGYGAGHNVARQQLAEALSPLPSLHLVLNPDVELAADALAAGLQVLAADKSAVLVAPVSRTPAGQREYLAKAHPSVRALLLRAFASGWLRRLFDRELARYEMRHLDDATEPAEIVLASGACMLVRRQALDVVGGFDERFFLYFEDYDLSRRLGRWGTLLQVPGMHIVHHGGGAARKGLRHIRWFASGGWRFFNRWGWRLW